MVYEIVIAGAISALLAVIVSCLFNFKAMKSERKVTIKRFACMEFLKITEKIFNERCDYYKKDKILIKSYMSQFNFALDQLKMVVNEDGIGKAEKIKKFLDKEFERLELADRYDNEVNQKSMELILGKYQEMAAEEELTHDYNKKMQSPDYRARLVKSAVRKCWKTIHNNTGFSNEKEDDVFENVVDNVQEIVEKKIKLIEENKRIELDENKRLRNLINEFVHYIREESK